MMVQYYLFFDVYMIKSFTIKGFKTGAAVMLATLVISSPSFAKDGLYTRAGFSHVNSDYKTNFYDVSFGTSSPNNYYYQFGLNIAGGYNLDISDSYYTQTEVFATYRNAKSDIASAGIELNSRYGFGAVQRFGFKTSESASLYAGLGVAALDFDYKFDNASKSQLRTYGVIQLGTKQKISQDLAAYLQYSIYQPLENRTLYGAVDSKLKQRALEIGLEYGF